MNPSLEQLLRSQPCLWQGRQQQHPSAVISTGFAALDHALHGGGWPLGATTELLGKQNAIGEWQLLLPALRQQTRWLALISPPFTPFAPAFAAAGIAPQRLLLVQARTARERLWSAEQLLRSGCCDTVISWQSQQGIGARDLRRLQQASAQGQCWHVLFRPPQYAQQAAASALRIQYQAGGAGQLRLQIHKQRGGWGGQQLTLALPGLQPVAGNRVSAWQPDHASTGADALAQQAPGP